MDIKSALEKLKSSDEYEAWKASHKDAYLTHVFAMLSKDEALWQVGYYDPEDSLIYSFEIDDNIKMNDPETPFGPEDKVIEEIKTDDINIRFVEVMDTVSELQQEKYPSHKPVKKIVILQVLEGFGLVYNVTYVTESFKTLNIKVDAKSGKVVEDNLVEIFKMSPGARS